LDEGGGGGGAGISGRGARVGIAGSEGSGAILTETAGVAPVAPLPAGTAAVVGIGGKVGTGGSVGSGARVGQGVGVGQDRRVGDGNGVGVVSVETFTASRRATRSQAATKLIRLRAISVALKPLPTLVGCFRGRGRSAVIFVLLVVAAAVPAVTTAISATTTATRRLARCNLVVGGLQVGVNLLDFGLQLGFVGGQLSRFGLHFGLERSVGGRDGLL